MTFAKGHKKHGGRSKGTPNKVASSIRQAILEAGEFVGAGGKFVKGRVIPGKDGLKGYLCEIAVTQPDLYVGLLAKTMPFEMTGPDGGPIPIIHGDLTLNEAARVYARMLREGSYAVSDEEQAEIEGVIENGNVRLIGKNS